MEEGLIDAAVAASAADGTSPRGVVARSEEEIIHCAGNSYEASFSLEALNRLPEGNRERLAVVGLPCQVEALGKMRAHPASETARIRNVRLVLGLFCGWALLPHAFHEFLRQRIDPREVIKFDIPHHPANSFDVYDRSGVTSIDLDQIRPYVNPACTYCMDMTSEFADISVGSGRRMYGWNTVVIRNERGQELYEKAKCRGLIEEMPYPQENLDHLKQASLSKKRRALERIIRKTGSEDNLIYLAGSTERRQEFLSLLEP
jgi:coenzyme F420 hydrogenase subunit beta